MTTTGPSSPPRRPRPRRRRAGVKSTLITNINTAATVDYLFDVDFSATADGCSLSDSSVSDNCGNGWYMRTSCRITLELTSQPADTVSIDMEELTALSTTPPSWQALLYGESDCESDTNSFTFQTDTAGDYVFNVTADIYASAMVGDPAGESSSDSDTASLTISVAEF
jgi:hypothetical protein